MSLTEKPNQVVEATIDKHENETVFNRIRLKNTVRKQMNKY